VLHNHVKSLCGKPFPLTDETACSCRPDKQPTCVLYKTLNGLLAQPASGKRTLLGDVVEIMFQENAYIMVYN
jgi:hypothetical protein